MVAVIELNLHLEFAFLVCGDKTELLLWRKKKEDDVAEVAFGVCVLEGTIFVCQYSIHR